MNEPHADLDRYIVDEREASHALLADLVRQPSTLGRVRPAQEILFRASRRFGLDACLWEIEPDIVCAHPDFAPTSWNQVGQPNLTAKLEASGTGGRSLVLNGHIDVVSAEPTDWWTHDPWGAEIVKDRLYGRGALDMKSGLVAALLAIAAVRNSGIGLRAPVIFESVVEEECTGNGMLASRLRNGPADAVIITEPTDETTWTATPGVLWFDLSFRGRPGYVGRAAEPVNAIETAAQYTSKLKPRIVDRLNQEFDHPAFAEMNQPLGLNIGVISGGDWPSMVPLECSVSCRMSYPISWSFAEARSFVEDQVLGTAMEDAWLAETPPTIRFPGFRAHGWEADIGGTLLKSLSASHEQISGDRLIETVFPGTADARYVDPSTGAQAAYYGPTGGNIHAPDEYVELASIERVARTLARLMIEWCGIC